MILHLSQLANLGSLEIGFLQDPLTKISLFLVVNAIFIAHFQDPNPSHQKHWRLASYQDYPNYEEQMH